MRPKDCVEIMGKRPLPASAMIMLDSRGDTPYKLGMHPGYYCGKPPHFLAASSQQTPINRQLKRLRQQKEERWMVLGSNGI